MARALVVEREAGAVVADLDDAAAIDVDPAAAARGRARAADAGCVDGVERVAEKHVLDVHEQQLLVLLLVVQAELDERATAVQVGRRPSIRQSCIASSTCARYSADLGDRGPGQQAALRAGMPRADLLVVRVEQVVVRRVERGS